VCVLELDFVLISQIQILDPIGDSVHSYWVNKCEVALSGM